MPSNQKIVDEGRKDSTANVFDAIHGVDVIVSPTDVKPFDTPTLRWKPMVTSLVSLLLIFFCIMQQPISSARIRISSEENQFSSERIARHAQDTFSENLEVLSVSTRERTEISSQTSMYTLVPIEPDESVTCPCSNDENMQIMGIMSFEGDPWAGTVNISIDNISTSIIQTLIGKSKGDLFGRSVALSSDMKLLAIAAPFADVYSKKRRKIRMKSNVGAVYVYKKYIDSNQYEEIVHVQGRCATEMLGIYGLSFVETSNSVILYAWGVKGCDINGDNANAYLISRDV